MNAEKVYIYLLVLSTSFLIYLNSQLRLINSGLKIESFGKFSLTSWKVYAEKGFVSSATRYIEATLAIVGYVAAVLTPLFVMGFYFNFNSEVGEIDLHVSVKTLIAVALTLLVIFAKINIFQILTKPYHVSTTWEVQT